MSLVISKAVRLIDLVAEGVDTLADISRSAKLSRSTAHRLLSTLVSHNYIAIENKRYVLGNRLFELGAIRKRSFDFLETLRPILLRYAEETTDTIHLAILDGQDMLLIDRVFGDRQLRINSYPGLRTPAFMTAVGKVLISKLARENWPNYLTAIPDGYPRTADGLLAELSKAQAENVAFDKDECNIGTCGVASSFMVSPRTRVACSINGAMVYFENGRLEALADTALSLAGDLSEKLNRTHATEGLSSL